MGFLKIFSGKNPEEYEKSGDMLFEKKEYGAAKIEYETALSKLTKKVPDEADLKKRIERKIYKTKNVLAFYHKGIGEKMLEDENYADAEEKFRLAMELTEDKELKIQLEEKIREIETRLSDDPEDFHNFHVQEEEDEEDGEDEDYRQRLDEYFLALCGSLPEQMANEYRSYGDDFKVGYVALNHGDFDVALSRLSQAAKENASEGNFIHLELANAHFNLEQYGEARSLLQDFLKKHPDSLQGYHLLCEIYWELKEYDLAQESLISSPSELQQSLPIQLLIGGTYFHAGRYEEAETFYHDFLKNNGWNDVIARELALTYEALGKKEDACDIFEEIMGSCRDCGCRVDPFLKRKYADLCFEIDRNRDSTLELYLTLVHEDPKNKGEYYQKISEIYSSKGNTKEQRRYKVFAAKSQEKSE